MIPGCNDSLALSYSKKHAGLRAYALLSPMTLVKYGQITQANELTYHFILFDISSVNTMYDYMVTYHILMFIIFLAGFATVDFFFLTMNIISPSLCHKV